MQKLIKRSFDYVEKDIMDGCNPSIIFAFLRFERVVRRFEQQQAGVRTLDTPIHVIRLGDLIIATNRFELYVDFGLQIKVRCGDLPHVLLVQLCGEGSYLSTEKSVAAGGYGSTIAGSPIGPNGGRELVGQTVSLIEEVWNSNE